MPQKRMLYYSMNPSFIGTPQQPIGSIAGAGFLVPMLDCPRHGVRTALEVCANCPDMVGESIHFIECKAQVSKQQMDKMKRESAKAPKPSATVLDVPEGVFNPNR